MKEKRCKKKWKTKKKATAIFIFYRRTNSKTEEQKYKEWNEEDAGNNIFLLENRTEKQHKKKGKKMGRKEKQRLTGASSLISRNCDTLIMEEERDSVTLGCMYILGIEPKGRPTTVPARPKVPPSIAGWLAGWG